MAKTGRMAAKLAPVWGASPLNSVLSCRLRPRGQAPEGAEFAIGGVAADGGAQTEDLAHALAVLATTFVLMAQPGLARVSRPPSSPRPTPYPAPAQTPSGVKVVELRRPPSPPREDAEPSGREYHCQWVVRGHWRDQAWGPKRSRRRPVWIAPYVKGPDGAPLVEKTVVNVWRR